MSADEHEAMAVELLQRAEFPQRCTTYCDRTFLVARATAHAAIAVSMRTRAASGTTDRGKG